MPAPKRNFWIELKRRSVYQVATIYIVTAWVLIQAADTIFPSLDIPDWITSLLIKIIILGFPITLIFSWIFEITTKGIVVTKFDSDIDKDRETKRIYVISVIIFSVLIVFSLAFTYFAFFRAPVKDKMAVEKSALASFSPPPNSLAVLPFQNNSKDKDDYFSDGMMVEIMSKLFSIEGLTLKSRTSTNMYKNNTVMSVREIASQLGVAHILEGTITTDPLQDKVRINISLVDGQTENTIWTYDEFNEMDDIFSVQSEIATRIADHLKVTLSSDVKERIESPSTNNPATWKLYMRAQWAAYNQDDYEEAEKLVDEAIKQDPNFADAYAFKGYLWLARGAWLGQAEPKEVIKNAFPLLQKAKELNPSSPLTHVFLASMYLWFDWDFEAAEKEWNEFFRLSPSNPPDPGYVDFLNASGRFVEAVDYSNRILASDHNIPDSWGTTGLAYYFNGQEEEAVSHYNDALNRFPEIPSIISDAARTFLYTGHYARVVELLQTQESKQDKAAPRALGLLAIAYEKLGNTTKAQKILDILKKLATLSSTGSPSFYTAMVLAQKQKKEEAFYYLQEAFDKHEVEMFWLKVEPPFTPLRDDLRWFGLLQKIGIR